MGLRTNGLTGLDLAGLANLALLRLAGLHGLAATGLRATGLAALVEHVEGVLGLGGLLRAGLGANAGLRDTGGRRTHAGAVGVL